MWPVEGDLHSAWSMGEIWSTGWCQCAWLFCCGITGRHTSHSVWRTFKVQKMKRSIAIESKSPGLRVRTESKRKFPALICFHYLSKAIVSLFSFHNSVWYERMMFGWRDEKGQTLLLSLSSLQQSMWLCVALGSNCSGITISDRQKC